MLLLLLRLASAPETDALPAVGCSPGGLAPGFLDAVVAAAGFVAGGCAMIVAIMGLTNMP